MGEGLNVKSDTGVIHFVSHSKLTHDTISVKTLCGYRRWTGNHEGPGLCPGPKVWTRTDEDVTCKRCLKEPFIKFSEDEVKRLIKILRLVDPCFMPRHGQITDCLEMLERKISLQKKEIENL